MLNAKLLDYLDDVGKATSAAQAARRLISFGLLAGAQSVHTFFGTMEDEQFVSTLPDWWIPYQCEDGKMMRQHQIQIVRSGPSTFYWGLDICPRNRRATPEGIERARETHRILGTRSSVVFPTASRDGTYEGGGISFGFSDDGDKFFERMAEDESTFRIAAMAAHAQFIRWGLGKRTQDNPLSPRQRDVLSYLATGHRAAAIAEGLEISVSAVNAYIQNARRKLNARTPEQAVAIALIEGWISL